MNTHEICSVSVKCRRSEKLTLHLSPAETQKQVSTYLRNTHHRERTANAKALRKTRHSSAGGSEEPPVTGGPGSRKGSRI